MIRQTGKNERIRLMETKKSSDQKHNLTTNILYVDDEHQNLRIFKIIFRKRYNVWTAQTVADALEILDKEAVHILITDQNMPTMRGTEFLGKVNEEYPDTVKIILSGLTDTPRIAEAIDKFNVFDTVEKPFVEAQLIEIFTRAEKKYKENTAQND